MNNKFVPIRNSTRRGTANSDLIKLRLDWYEGGPELRAGTSLAYLMASQ